MVKLGDTFPNFTAETTEGQITFNDWAGDSWVCFCSHPADFTPVCTTELGLLTQIIPEFTKRNTKVIALSCNPVDSHLQWQTDIMKHAGAEGGAFPYPIVDDTSRELAVQLGMVDPEEVSSTGAPMTCRAVFIIGPDKKIKLSILYPASCGRNFDEVLRALDSLQMTVCYKVATPVNWKKGDECMVVPSVKDADVGALFPKGVRIEAVPSGKGYLRFTPDPSPAAVPTTVDGAPIDPEEEAAIDAAASVSGEGVKFWGIDPSSLMLGGGGGGGGGGLNAGAGPMLGADGAGLPPPWLLGGIEAPAGEKKMGKGTFSVYTEEQQARLGVDETGNKVEAAAADGSVAPVVMGRVGPAWTRGEMEAPAGEKDMGGYVVAAYTEEQQTRLCVDEKGNKVAAPAAAADTDAPTPAEGVGSAPPRMKIGQVIGGDHRPQWMKDGTEGPAGMKDMGSWKKGIFTEEQQERLGVDEDGHVRAAELREDT